MGGGGFSTAIGQLPYNLQNYIGGPSYPGMQTGNQPGGQGNYNAMTQDMSRGQMGNYGFSPQGFQYQAWPGQGYGGMPGRYNQPGRGAGSGYGGYFGGSGFGYGGGGQSPYGPGSYSSPGAMPYGGGSGMMGGSLFNQRGMLGRAMGAIGRGMGGYGGGYGGGMGGYGGGGMGGYGGGGMGGYGGGMGGYGGGGWGGYRGYAPPQPAQQVPQYINQRSPYAGQGYGSQQQLKPYEQNFFAQVE